MPKQYEAFVESHAQVGAWLKNRPEETRRKFARYLEEFCKAMSVAPEEWRNLDKFAARDLAWEYVQRKVAAGHLGTARFVLTTLKSWYRNKNGEQLPFDSGRGGKHYLPASHPKRSLEHIPSKHEMYQIVDMASSLRDKAILLFLFQSGVRVNVLEHITYGAVSDQLDKDIIVLKITGDLDHKLRSRDIPFYYTFLNGEGSETLKRYCEIAHTSSNEDTPLFYTRSRKPVTKMWVWRIVKMCVARAGFDPKTIWTHTIRKAFRRQLAQATDVEFEFKEMIMGHVLPGSRENYFDRRNLGWFLKEYQKLNFGREAIGSEVAQLKAEMEQRLREKDAQIHKLKERLNGFTLRDDQMQQLLKRIEKLEKQAQKQ